jgi:hypothetical protein
LTVKANSQIAIYFYIFLIFPVPREVAILFGSYFVYTIYILNFASGNDTNQERERKKCFVNLRSILVASSPALVAKQLTTPEEKEKKKKTSNAADYSESPSVLNSHTHLPARS